MEKAGAAVSDAELATDSDSTSIASESPVLLVDQPAPRHSNSDRNQGGSIISPAQERLWYLDQLDPGNPVHTLTASVQVKGPLDRTLLSHAFDELLERHEILRSRFAVAQGRIVAVVENATSGWMILDDLSGFDAAAQATELARRTDEQAQAGFDLSSAPLFRARLMRLHENHHVLVLTVHEIVSDQWSLGLIVREAAGLYAALRRGDPWSTASSLFKSQNAGDIHACHPNRELDRQLKYWREQLRDVPVLQLPTDFPRPAILSYKGSRIAHPMKPALSEQVRRLCRESGATPFMVVLAGFEAVLSRWSGQTDVAVGIPVLNRETGGRHAVVGPLENTMVLRGDLSGDPSFLSLLARVRATVLQAQARADAPFERVVDELQPRRERNRSPLFQVMLASREPNLDCFTSAGLTFQPCLAENGTAKFDLTLYLNQGEEQIGLALEYAADLFQEETIKRMVGHLERILEQALGSPEIPLSHFDLLSREEHSLVLEQWNATSRDYGPAFCMHELFEAQVERTPHVSAAEFGGHHLSYSELNQRANRVAHLLQGLGVGPEVRVGLCMERGLDMIVGLLGILKAGGAYVPLDPKYPPDRLRFMLKDSRAVALLTHSKLRDQLADFAGQMICLDHAQQQLADQPDCNPRHTVRPDNLAYLIYTSGSTGTPKGVAIQHHSAFTLICWAKEVFAPQQLACMLFSTSICFDLSIFEIFVPLSWGYRVVIVENLFHFPALSPETGVTFVNTVPSVMAELLRTGSLPKSVNTVALAGEALAKALVEQVYQQSGVGAVLNLYGPSEDTTYSTWALLEKKSGRPVPIGKPIADTQIYIVDEAMQPVPVGVAGQLYIGGAGLARCYLDRPALTAQSFVPNAFGRPGSRLYRTGDLARWRDDGSLDYLGRADHQVKVRGFRIECGEIEAALVKDPAIEEAIVVAKNLHGATQLVAYYVPVSQDTPVDSSELRKRLLSRLPEYMIPIAFVPLAKLPSTPNGKTDRKALMAREVDLSTNAEYVAPRNPLEAALVKCWSEVLRVEQVGIRDNFFEFGGHSLLAVQLVYKMNLAAFPCSIRDLQDHPTIENLIEHAAPSAARDETAPASAGGGFPLLPVQIQVMNEEAASEDGFRRPVPILMHLAETISESTLIQALELWYKQDIFRLRFKKEGSGWRQFYQERNDYEYCPIQELEIEDSDDEAGLIRRAVDVAHALLPALNIFSGPIIQVALIKQQGKPRFMLWLTDHLFIDTNSFMILYTNFTLAYKQVQRKSRVQFPKDIILCQWAEHLSQLATDPQLAGECGFWKGHFTPDQEPRSLSAAAGPGERIEPEHFVDLLDKHTTARVQEFMAKQGISFEELCLGNFLEACRRVLGIEKQLLRMVGSGRENTNTSIDLSRGLGWFSIEYPAVFDLRQVGDPITFIHDVVRQHRAYAGHRENYGILRYLNPQTGSELAAAENWRSGIAFNCVGHAAMPRSREQVARLTSAWTEVVKGFALRGTEKHRMKDSALDPKHGPYRRATFSIVDGTIKVSLSFFTARIDRDEMQRLLGAIVRGFQKFVR